MPRLVVLDLLPSSLSAQELHDFVGSFPGVIRTHLLRDSSGRSLGSAVIEVESTANRDDLITRLDGLYVFGRPIRASRLDGDNIAA